MRELPGVLLTAGRLIVRHWPAFLVLAFAGTALRQGALWAAVEVSDVQGQLGQLLLVLAPLGYLLPVIAMLHICKGSLPRLQGTDLHVSPTEGRERRLVDIAVSVLVPFLAVYVSYGFLEMDFLRFRNEAAGDEFNNAFNVTPDYRGRLGIYSAQVALMIVVIAWVLRWALGRFEKRTHFLALAFVGALVEVYYTAQLAAQTVVIKTRGMEWLGDRVAYRWITDGYEALLDRVGFLADTVRSVVDFGQTVLGSFDTVVVVPIAWLAVGAVVLGHQLDDDNEDEDARQVVPGRRAEPGGLVSSFAADLRGRWSAFFKGLRLLSAAGLYPMLLFSLVFIVALRAPVLATELMRQLVGPTKLNTWLAITPYQGALGQVVSMVVTAPLLAAAVDWLVSARRARRPAPEAPRSPARPTTALPQ